MDYESLPNGEGLGASAEELEGLASSLSTLWQNLSDSACYTRLNDNFHTSHDGMFATVGWNTDSQYTGMTVFEDPIGGWSAMITSAKLLGYGQRAETTETTIPTAPDAIITIAQHGGTRQMNPYSPLRIIERGDPQDAGYVQEDDCRRVQKTVHTLNELLSAGDR